MENYLIKLKCEDPSVFKLIEKESGEIIEKGIIHDGKTICLEAIVSKKTLNKLKKIGEVEVKGDIQKIGEEKQKLVGKGNRYKN